MNNTFQRLMSRVKNLFTVGDVTGVDDGLILQIKTATGRTNDRIKRINDYGFQSRPLPGSKSYLLFAGGVMSRGISFCVADERHEITLAEGEVAMVDDKGNLIHFTESMITVIAKGAIDIQTAKEITIKGEKISLNGGAGVVTGECICPFTGSPHSDFSKQVTAGK